MAKTIIANNVVTKQKMREVQKKTLHQLSEILSHSFGPNGSNTCIKKENAFPRYTKDGHSIIGAIQYNGIVEQSIKDDIESVTRHIVKTVGDGTTSAVIMSSVLFDHICKEDANYKPIVIVDTLNKVVDRIKTQIKNSAKEFTLQDVYDIAMISTNGNTFIAEQLQAIYKEYGNEVFIDVTPSIGEDFLVKDYDGMTISSGYPDSCYVTNTKNNTAEVDNPEVYFFEHPVDTRELGVYLDAIISRNIVQPVNNQDYDNLVPTVIFAPMISQDMSSIMDSLVSTMAQMSANNRLPICIITGYQDVEPLMDLAKMCGAKLIRKYIDQKVYQQDVATGKAPTPETIFSWAGHCDRIVAYSDKTVFIRPREMYNEDGSYSNLYLNLVNFLEVEVKKATENGEDPMFIGRLKRRLHSLKSNMVELLVGGITQADRDSLRDLVEDAVLNIRSAATYGVGFGANISGAVAAYKAYIGFINKKDDDTYSLENSITMYIWFAYYDLLKKLYGEIKEFTFMEDDTPKFDTKLILQNSEKGLAYNLRTNEWTTNVKSSIMSDITILDTVCKIVGIMATANQFILPTAMHNIYEDFSEKPSSSCKCDCK